MLEQIFLQVESGGTILMAIIVAVVISAIFYGIQRRSISAITKKLQPLANLDPKIQYDVSRMDAELKTAYSDLTNLKINLPHTDEVRIVEENIKKLCGDFTDLKTNIDAPLLILFPSKSTTSYL